MKKILVTLIASASLALSGTAVAGTDPGGAGGTYWQNTGVSCQSNTGRTFWHHTLYNIWRCAYWFEL